MKTYIGMKTITATPMYQADAAASGRAKELGPSGRDVFGYAVDYPDGYKSWSPRDVFEAAYREVPAEDANTILVALQNGLGILALGGRLFSNDAPRDRETRTNALSMALKSMGDRPPTLDVTELLRRADQIATYINEGATAPTADAIREAEQRGYNAARPLDPGRIEIGGIEA